MYAARVNRHAHAMRELDPVVETGGLLLAILWIHAAERSGWLLAIP